jgi:hypothetical protein
MYGVMIIRLADLLPVTSFVNAAGVTPRSLLITGTDFVNVESVLIGGIPAPEFVLLGKNQLLAQVPSFLVDEAITEVSVFAYALRATRRSLVEFTVGTRPRKVRGILRLLQNYIRILLRTPGTNRFHKNSGGGLRRGIGQNLSVSAAADVVASVSRTTSYFLGVQARDGGIPPSERLLSASVENVVSDPGTGTLYVTISLLTHTGEQGIANLAF